MTMMMIDDGGGGTGHRIQSELNWTHLKLTRQDMEDRERGEGREKALFFHIENRLDTNWPIYMIHSLSFGNMAHP
jgi:hypothetical protein